jgi:alpha-L-rhamnosidase
MAMALDIGAVPSADISTVTGKLVSAINTAGGFAVGEIGLTPLFRVLNQSGNNQLAYTSVTANKIGGYGYFVAQGATSLPEYWDLSNSRNHFMLGGVDLWMNSALVGISQAAGSIGYQKLVIKPSVVGGMTSASGTLQTAYGQVSSAWTTGTTGLTLQVGIPVGSTATVYVPITGTAQPVTPTGATYVATSGSYAQYTVGSGNYSFAPAS